MEFDGTRQQYFVKEDDIYSYGFSSAAASCRFLIGTGGGASGPDASELGTGDLILTLT